MLPTRFEWLLAVRRWTARPALTVTAVGILALGLGFTVSLYSIVDTVLLRELPWRDPERLVAVYVTRPHWRTNPVLAGSWDRGNLTWFTVKDLQGKSPAFESFSGWRMPAGALREAGRGGSAARSRTYPWVVAAQVALAVVLLLGAGLLAETVRQLASQPLGFDADRLVVTSLRLPPIAGATAAQRAARMQALVDLLAATPGVRSAAATSTAPFSGSAGGSSFQIPGRTFDRDPNANRHIVTERYFETLGVRLLKGRVFDGTDQSGAHAAVVTDEFERVFMDGDALDKRFVLNGDVHTIVGVIAAPKHRRFTDPPPIAFYALSRQLPAWATPTLIAKTAGDPEAYLSTLRQTVAAAEPQASFVTLETMTTMTQRSIADERYRAQLALIFGGMAVLLSAIGLYGLVTSLVNERRREMGIRVALGARPTQVRGLVLTHALRLVGAGLLVGVPAALAAAQGLASFLFGVPPTSPAVVLLVVATIAGAAFVAALGPAVRASRIHPTEALRAGS